MRHEEILYVALGAAAVGLLFARTRKIVGAGSMQDTPVSLENVRKGIARGWYSAQLCTVDGRPAVKLSGTANGKPYSDYYPVTQSTWDALRKDGVQQIGRVCGIGAVFPIRRFNPNTAYTITIYGKRDIGERPFILEQKHFVRGIDSKESLMRAVAEIGRRWWYDYFEVHTELPNNNWSSAYYRKDGTRISFEELMESR